MERKTILRKRLNGIGWSLLLIWWGLRWSVLIGLPEGSGLLGTCVILFGAEVIRKSIRLPGNPNNIFFGLLAFLCGGTLFVMDVFHLPYQMPVFETFMIVLGVLILGYILIDGRKKTDTV